MLRLIQRTLLALALAGAADSASAFSLLGQFDATYQTPALNYNPGVFQDLLNNDDIGGPMNLGQEYRWNIKTITYGFDPSFMNYFGAQGTNAVMQAIAILNNLPPVSQMSSDLSEFPLETRRMNYQASAIGLVDLKSQALAILLEEMGVASPERYVWTLRKRYVNSTPAYTNYTVIMRNFDPVTWAPSAYVNGTLYTYTIEELPPPWPSGAADAIESSVDPLALSYSAVVSAADGFWGGGLQNGEFFTGLTRDDVGCLRYIYSPNNYNVETLLTNMTAGAPSPWTPVGAAPTNVVNTALRPGVDKIVFEQVFYNSVYGNFITVTQQYTDTYVTNSTLVTQNTQRVLTQPDILFAAGDLGIYNGYSGEPELFSRTIVWSDNAALNGQETSAAGPGQIEPQEVIVFSNIGPWIVNYWPSSLSQGTLNWVWGSFDGTTNEPIVYPIGTSIQDLEDQVLGGD